MKPLRVLIVEDSEDDTLLVLRELRRGGYEPHHAQVDTAEAMDRALEKQEWDLVLSDHSMPCFSSGAALALLQRKAVDLPFIIISGSIGEESAVAAMKAGAHDYLTKAHLARLAPAVERELREAGDRRTRRKAEEALRESEARLQRANRERAELQYELLRISECEKQTIAQELHDGLCQHFAGTALMGSLLYKRLAARNDPDAAQAKQICDLLNTGVHETRTLSHGLHPVQAGSDGLMEALAGLAQTVSNLFHLQCEFRCNDSVQIADQGAATHLFRIAQEAVNNARKHGEASQVVIALKNTRKHVVLSIRDNGIGIPSGHHVSRGMGVKIMNHRAEAIGARLAIRRAGKRGTVVTCTLPV